MAGVSCEVEASSHGRPAELHVATTLPGIVCLRSLRSDGTAALKVRCPRSGGATFAGASATGGSEASVVGDASVSLDSASADAKVPRRPLLD